MYTWRNWLCTTKNNKNILLFFSTRNNKKHVNKNLSQKSLLHEREFSNYLLTLCEASACSAPQAPPRPPAWCWRGWMGTALGNWTLNPWAESPENTKFKYDARFGQLCCYLPVPETLRALRAALEFVEWTTQALFPRIRPPGCTDSKFWWSGKALETRVV